MYTRKDNQTQPLEVTKQTKCSWRNLLRSRAYPALSYEIFVWMFFLRRGTTQTCPLPGSPPQEVCLCVCGDGTRMHDFTYRTVLSSHSVKNTTWYTVKVYLTEFLIRYVVYAAEILSSTAAVAVQVRCWRATRGVNKRRQ